MPGPGFPRGASIRDPGTGLRVPGTPRPQRPLAGRSPLTGDVGVAFDPEPPRVVAGFAGRVDADAGTACDVLVPERLARTDEKGRLGEVPSVMFQGYAQGLAQLARAVGEFPVILAPAPLAHDLDAPGWLQGPHQDGLRVPLFAAHHVEAVMDAVGNVDVREAGGAEHHFRALGAPSPVRMGGPIAGADVSLHFDDQAGRFAMDQFGAQ